MSDSTSLIERIAKWSHALNLDAVPDGARKVAKRCIVDLVGVSIAGAEREQSRRIADYSSRAYAPGPATVFGGPARLSPVGAALVNGAVGHVLDFD
ncbi:MAG: MmgE/PrpD family protein, partial [Gemmatimonadetes bacterium]|nr:MmgE/PrpD family protein [Gemmatimonadota bacterium]